MVLAARLSQAMGMLTESDVTRIVAVCERAKLPVRPPNGMSVDDFLTHMAVDKKNIDGRLRFVLIRSLVMPMLKNRCRLIYSMMYSTRAAASPIATSLYRTNSLGCSLGETIGRDDWRPGQGKSTVIEALVFASTVNPLLLDGELLSDRTDTILRLIGLAGLRPEGTDLEMLARLQNKHQAGTEQGIPEIIVDDAHRLPDDVLQLFQELSAGAYGRRWSILLGGGWSGVSASWALKPKPTLSSTVLLPRWDQHDLEEACTALHPGLEIAARAPHCYSNSRCIRNSC